MKNTDRFLGVFKDWETLRDTSEVTGTNTYNSSKEKLSNA